MNGNSEWLENKVAELLARLKRSGFFDSGIADAQHLHRVQGFAWDVALSMSVEYWTR